MDNQTRKIVILNKIRSPYIEQAIFILRPAAAPGERAVNEAEKIVSDYLKERAAPKAEFVNPKRSLLGVVLWVFAAAVSLGALLLAIKLI